MHSLLESYLLEVAAKLEPMPVKRRNDELREMRLHLENAVIVSRELGQSEEEAAQNIVAQFGTPEDLGENVVWVWRREQARTRRSFWGAAACTFASLFCLPLLFIAFPYGLWVPNACGVNSPLLAGVICGGFFSKRGLAGVAFGVALYYYGSAAIWIAYVLSQPILSDFMTPNPHPIMDSFTLQNESVLLTLFFAWAVNRWRLTRVKRSRQAVGL